MTKPKPKGEVFEGRSAEMKKESPWLASEDLMGLENVEVEIESCHRYKNVEFDKGRKEAVVYTVKFVGKKKELVLNATNRKKLVGYYGANVKEWVGKKVKLYVDPNVRLAGEIVSGIRIR